MAIAPKFRERPSQATPRPRNEPKMTHPEDPTPDQRPRWATLTDEQRDLASELVARANRLRDDANADPDSDGLSLRDAIALAAVQMGVTR